MWQLARKCICRGNKLGTMCSSSCSATNSCNLYCSRLAHFHPVLTRHTVHHGIDDQQANFAHMDICKKNTPAESSYGTSVYSLCHVLQRRLQGVEFSAPHGDKHPEESMSKQRIHLQRTQQLEYCNNENDCGSPSASSAQHASSNNDR